MKYTEYLYSSNKNVILFDEFISSKKQLSQFFLKQNEMLINLVINKNTSIFVNGKHSLLSNKNFLLVENNLYKFIPSAGKCQHYIQRNFVKNFIGTLYGCDNHRYLCTKKTNQLKNFKKKDSFKLIGSDDYYFSPEHNSYLDNYISSIEKISNDIIADINSNLKNRHYKYSPDEARGIFEKVAYPLYIKSSYHINNIHFNIKKSFNDMPNEYKEYSPHLSGLILDDKSEFYYMAIEDFIIDNITLVKKNISYRHIYFLDVESLPVSENVLFFYDDKKNIFEIGYLDSHCYFTFNENTVILFSSFEYTSAMIESSTANINKFLKFCIISNAHDFLITKYKIDDLILSEKRDYSYCNMYETLRSLMDFCNLKSSKTKSFPLKKNLSLPIIFNHISSNNDFLYLHNKFNSLANHEILIDESIYYIDKENKDKIGDYKHINHNLKSFEIVDGVVSRDLKQISNSENILSLQTKKVEIKKEIISQKNIYYSDNKMGASVFMDLGFCAIHHFVSIETESYLEKNFNVNLCTYHHYCEISKTKLAGTLKYLGIREIIFTIYNDNSTNISCIKLKK